MKNSLLVVLLLSGIASAQDLPFMTPDELLHYNSPQCAIHKAAPEYKIYADIAYVLEYCSSLVSIRDNDHVTGWKLHREAASAVDKIPCDCRYHTHRDNMSYNVYLLVVDDLANVNGVDSEMNKLCAKLSDVANQ